MADVLKHRSALCFYIIRNYLTCIIQFYAGYSSRPAFPWSDAGEKKQISDASGVWIKTNRLRCP